MLCSFFQADISLLFLKWMDGWMDGWMTGWMVGWMDGWMAGTVGVLTDGWKDTDGRMVGMMEGKNGWLVGR